MLLWALLGVTACADTTVGDGAETDAPLEDGLELAPPPSLELGEAATYDESQGRYTGFRPLADGDEAHPRYFWSLGCLDHPYGLVLKLRTDDIELPASARDWDDPSMPLVDLTLTTLDAAGEPVLEVSALERYPQWFEEREDGLEGELVALMMGDELSTALLDGAPVRLTVTLTTRDREPARSEIDMVLSYEDPP